MDSAEITGVVIGLAGLAIAYITLVVPINHYLGQKNLEEKDKRFKNYHQMIDDLVGSGKPAMRDRQIAIIFELRNYPEYYEVTERILNGLLMDWRATSHPSVIREINITLEKIRA